MSDVEVASAVVHRVEEALDRLGAEGGDASTRLGSLSRRVPEELARKTAELIATHRRLLDEPGQSLPDSAAFDSLAAEVLAGLEGLARAPALPNPADPPAAPLDFRTLPPLRAHRGSRPPPPPPIRGLRGWPMALLVAAVLATMAASVWL